MGITQQRVPTRRQLYLQKQKWLKENGYVEIKPLEFYRDLFPPDSFEREGHPEDNKGNGMLVKLKREGHPVNRIVFDSLDTISVFLKEEDVIVSPCSYCGRRRSAKAARFCFAIAIDIDMVGANQLRDLLWQAGNGIIAMPTYIANSGGGLHLYYVLNDPIPMYPEYQRYMKELKYALTERVWNGYTSLLKDKQYQGIVQGFRMVGSASKLGPRYPVKAYRTGKKVDIDYLMESLPEENVWEQRKKVDKTAKDVLELFKNKDYVNRISAVLIRDNKINLDEAKKKYPEWYQRRVVEKRPMGTWKCNQSLYNWWFNRIKTEIVVGHRYYAIFTLAIYAQKCGVTEEQLKKDAYSLLKDYENKTQDVHNHFTKKDIDAALQAFNNDLCRYPISEIARLSGLTIKKNKRNGRPRKLHIKIMSATRDLIYPDAVWRNKDGRPAGSGTKEQLIKDWKEKHPDGTKADCHRDTGIDPKTIRKWW